MAPCDRLLTNGPALILNVNANYLQMKTHISGFFFFFNGPTFDPLSGICYWSRMRYHVTNTIVSVETDKVA